MNSKYPVPKGQRNALSSQSDNPVSRMSKIYFQYPPTPKHRFIPDKARNLGRVECHSPMYIALLHDVRRDFHKRRNGFILPTIAAAQKRP